MAETRLVRIKRGERKQGFLLRRYTYKGIKFVVEKGWYRVDKDVADHLEKVRQVPGDEHSREAFDVCTDEEAKAIDERESREERPTLATDAVRVAEARGAEESAEAKPAKGSGRRAKPASS